MLFRYRPDVLCGMPLSVAVSLTIQISNLTSGVDVKSELIDHIILSETQKARLIEF